MNRALLIASLVSLTPLANASGPGATVDEAELKRSNVRPRPLSAKETARQKKLGKTAAQSSTYRTLDGDEAEVLEKRKIPQPPSDPAEYRAWRKKLSAKESDRLDRFCRFYGGSPTVACHGIGPLAIPEPPPLAPMPRPRGDEQAARPERWKSHEEWEASLTIAQHAYYADFCSRGEQTGYSELCGGTPLVLSFGNERVAYTAARSGDATDWPTSATPWLVMDRDGDGVIAAGEMFGNATPMATGHARNGFQPLVELDANGDGVLDARDPMFAALEIWTDANNDRQSSAAELSPLSDRVVSLSLSYSREAYCDARTNCEGERATMTWRDASGVHTGSIIDVYLAWQ